MIKQLFGGPLDGAEIENPIKPELRIPLKIGPVRLAAVYRMDPAKKEYLYYATRAYSGTLKSADYHAEPVYYAEDKEGRRYAMWQIVD